MSKLLTTIEKEKLLNFNNLTYVTKEKLKSTNIKKYNNLILLQEKFNESKVVISHKKYKTASINYNNKIATSINPQFFITIKYIDSVASSPERVVSMFSNIKYELTRTRDYKFQHYVEQGIDGSFHSHILVSGLKNKSNELQIEWFIKQLNNYKKLNKYSITNAEDSIDVRLFNNKELAIPIAKRVSYVSKQDNRNYLSLDLINTDFN